MIFDIYVFAIINFMRKIERNYKKKSKVRLNPFYLVMVFYDDPQQ